MTAWKTRTSTGLRRLESAKLWSHAGVASASGGTKAEPQIAVLHGVEYVEDLVQTGRLKFSKTVLKKSPITTLAILAAAAKFTKRLEPSCVRFLESSWWRWSAIGAGLGVVAVAVGCRRPIRSWRNGTPRIGCADKPAPISLNIKCFASVASLPVLMVFTNDGLTGVCLSGALNHFNG